ncbi:MAG: hypothetical protein HOP03_11645 [Lysobacter sp.]|nr:hypothetical protein [Lysobacter sp.]
MSLRFATYSLALSLLSGCVAFERAPVSKLSCDPALAGRWQPVKDGPLDNIVEIGPDCTLRWPDEAGGFHRATLTGFTLGDDRYLVFSPTDADRLMAAEGDLIRSAPKGSVFLARYRIEGDSALLWLPDPQIAMQAGTKGEATGRRIEDELIHVEGDRRAIATLLRTRGDAMFRMAEARGTLALRRLPLDTAR